MGPQPDGKTMARLTLVVLASLASSSVLAGAAPVVTPVSEPGILGLFAAAAVALLVLKKFRK